MTVSMDLFVTHAAALARDVEKAASRRAFRSAVDEFEQLLSRVSDYPPDFLTDRDVGLPPRNRIAESTSAGGREPATGA